MSKVNTITVKAKITHTTEEVEREITLPYFFKIGCNLYMATSSTETTEVIMPKSKDYATSYHTGVVASSLSATEIATGEPITEQEFYDALETVVPFIGMKADRLINVPSWKLSEREPDEDYQPYVESFETANELPTF